MLKKGFGWCIYTISGHSPVSVVRRDAASLYGLCLIGSDAASPGSPLGTEDVKIGTGGWAYLPLESGDRLRAYGELFDYVEVNTSFYHVPRLGAVRSWRRRVPPGFTFSVKCNRRATHELGLTPSEETFRVLERMRVVLRLLRSDMLVLQTPPRLYVDKGKVREVAAILPSAGLGGAQVFWEDRSPKSLGRVEAVREAMLREGIVPVVDLTVEPPWLGLP